MHEQKNSPKGGGQNVTPISQGSQKGRKTPKQRLKTWEENHAEKHCIEYNEDHRGVPEEIQNKLGLVFVSHDEAVKRGFGKDSVSPLGGLLIPYNKNSGISPGWSPPYPPKGHYLRNLLPNGSDELKAWWERIGGKDSEEYPKYVSPCGDLNKSFPFYDPMAWIVPQNELEATEIVGFTEDIYGAIKAALLGKRIISTQGVWLVTNDQLGDWLKGTRHPFTGFVNRFLADNDAYTKKGVCQALIRTGFVLGAKVGAFEPSSEKIGLDEAIDTQDEEALEQFDTAKPVEEWITQDLFPNAARLITKDTEKSRFAVGIAREIYKFCGDETWEKFKEGFEELGMGAEGFGQAIKPEVNLQPGQQYQNILEIERHIGGRTDSILVMRPPGGCTSLVKVTPGRGNDPAKLKHLNKDAIQFELVRCLRFTLGGQEKKGKDEPTQQYPVDPPKDLSALLLAKGEYPELNGIKGITLIPLLNDAGEVINLKGYDPSTELYFDSEPEKYSFHDHPTKADAIAALDKLKSLLSEFPYDNEVSKSVAICHLITLVTRKAYELAPLFLFTASTPGSGKGTHIMVGNAIQTGCPSANILGWISNPEEQRKAIFAALLSGAQSINFDNVTSRLGGAVIERLLTAPIFSDRILGVSKQASVENQAIITANGNNAHTTPDMFRRTLVCRLEPNCERPEQREFERDIVGYALEHRSELIEALLTIPRAYFLAGCPDIESHPPLISFQRWDKFVRQPLLWLDQADPLTSQDSLRENDLLLESNQRLFQVWDEVLGDSQWLARDIAAMATEHVTFPQDSLGQTIPGSNDFEALREAFEDAIGKPEITPRIMARFLRTKQDQIYSGMKLIRNKDKNTNSSLWSLKPIN